MSARDLCTECREWWTACHSYIKRKLRKKTEIINALNRFRFNSQRKWPYHITSRIEEETWRNSKRQTTESIINWICFKLRQHKMIDCYLCFYLVSHRYMVLFWWCTQQSTAQHSTAHKSSQTPAVAAAEPPAARGLQHTAISLSWHSFSPSLDERSCRERIKEMQSIVLTVSFSVRYSFI